MHLHIKHQTVLRFAAPAKSLIAALRMEPYDCAGQHVGDWRLDVDADCRMSQTRDAYGNNVRSLHVDGPIHMLTLTAQGEARTSDASGVVRGARENFPAEFYLRETEASEPDGALRAFVDAVAGSAPPLEAAHRLMDAVHESITLEKPHGDLMRKASTAFAARAGAVSDIAQIMTTSARIAGIPARYVCGYRAPAEGAGAEAAPHAWSELYIENLGVVGFDAAEKICAHDGYLRLATALDRAGAEPLRLFAYGPAAAQIETSVAVRRL